MGVEDGMQSLLPWRKEPKKRREGRRLLWSTAWRPCYEREGAHSRRW